MKTLPLLKSFILGALLSSLSPLVLAQSGYKVSGQVYTTEHAPGSWDGRHEFPGVFCTHFPMADKASQSRWALFNNFSIYLADVAYPENLYVLIVSSRIPKSRTTEQEAEALLANERNTESMAGKAGFGYQVEVLQSGFGPTIGVTTLNPAPGSAGGPFPLTRSFVGKAADPLQSMSVHRIFVRGEDRFEIAVIQMERLGTAREVLSKRLAGMADEMMQNMQKCTLAMPPKKAPPAQ